MNDEKTIVYCDDHNLEEAKAKLLKRFRTPAFLILYLLSCVGIVGMLERLESETWGVWDISILIHISEILALIVFGLVSLYGIY